MPVKVFQYGVLSADECEQFNRYFPEKNFKNNHNLEFSQCYHRKFYCVNFKTNGTSGPWVKNENQLISLIFKGSQPA